MTGTWRNFSSYLKRNGTWIFEWLEMLTNLFLGRLCRKLRTHTILVTLYVHCLQFCSRFASAFPLSHVSQRLPIICLLYTSSSPELKSLWLFIYSSSSTPRPFPLLKAFPPSIAISKWNFRRSHGIGEVINYVQIQVFLIGYSHGNLLKGHKGQWGRDRFCLELRDWFVWIQTWSTYVPIKCKTQRGLESQ